MEISERGSESTRGTRSARFAAASALVAVVVPGPAAAAELTLFPSLPVLASNLVAFLVLIYPMSRLVLRPLIRILEERENRTSGAIAEAEEFTRETLTVRGEIGERLRAAAAGAQSLRGEIAADADLEQRELLAEARGEAARIVESVRVSVAAELEQARDSLRADARALASQAAEKILGRAV